MLEKNPHSLFWNSFLSPRVSQRNGTVHYLLCHLYFYCTSKQSSSTTKNQWGLILHYLTPTLHNPTADKAIPLAYSRGSGKVLSTPYQLDRVADFGPLPILSCRHRHEKYNTHGGRMMSLPFVPLCAAQLITKTLVFGDFTAQDSLFWGRIYVLFHCLFLL